MERVLILASVASMIDQFNMPNIILLQKMGYVVDVACNFKGESTCTGEKITELKNNLKKMDVQCYQIDFSRDVKNICKNVKAFRQVERILGKNHYKFLHCHSPIGGVIGRLAGKLKKTKVIYTAHGFHFYKGAPAANWLIYYSVEKICSYMTDVLICINKEDYALAKKRMKAKKIVYIPGVGIDLSKFGNGALDKRSKRSELGVPSDKLWILAVGELSKRKNHELLIKAVEKVEDVYLTIAGKGELEDELLSLIQELGIESRVSLIGFRKDVSELCEAADVFAFPSYQEGLPVALMEAMASSKPVICSNIRGNTDLIDEGKGGFYFEPDNLEQIVEAIKKLERSDLCELGIYNKQKIQRFDLTDVMTLSEKIYEITGGV